MPAQCTGTACEKEKGVCCWYVCVCVCKRGKQQQKQQYFLFVLRVLCWRAEIFNCRFNGEWPNGFWFVPLQPLLLLLLLSSPLSPALLRLCKCQQSACCCPATALYTHKKYVFFTLPFIFAHRLRWKARERESERGAGENIARCP